MASSESEPRSARRWPRLPARLPSFGLRPRLLSALVLTAAVTLAVAALALLSPLEQRLRQSDENSEVAAVVATVPHYRTISIGANGEPLKADLDRLAEGLRKQFAGAEIAVLDHNLNVISQIPGPRTGDQDIPTDWSDVVTAISDDRPNHSLNGDALFVAQPLEIHGRRYGLSVRRRLTYVPQAVNTVRSAFLKAAVVGLLVAIVLGVGLSRTLLRRLERLRDATRELERQGPDAVPPEDHSRDEIGELTRTFAAMQQRLGRQEDARRAFVATASHELRTPLASLDGLLELLNDDLDAEHLDLDDARDRASRAKEQVRRLSALAGDLLDLSRLDAQVELRTEPLELRELCRAVAAEFDLRARAGGVMLDVRQPPAPCWAIGDPGSVARIVRILLDNALRAAPCGSTIEVSTATDHHRAMVTVTDAGPGVPRHERELIFERFQRGSSAAGRSGFGLGLAIGRELAERMGGTLTLLTRHSRAATNGSAAHYGSESRGGRLVAGARAGAATAALSATDPAVAHGGRLAGEVQAVEPRGPGASFQLALVATDVSADGGASA